MNISFIDLKSQYESIKDEIDFVIQDVIQNSAFIGGKYLNSFLDNFAKYNDISYCVGVGNGTDAIFIALKCAGIGIGDEVITVANTFIATAEAISMTGAKVVFVDCDEKTYTIDIERLEKAITKKTKAIVPVHLYGQPCEIDEIVKIAKKNNLIVVEDCAQAHGAEYNGRKVGTFGDIGCFSFFPGKNLGAYGDAGAIIGNNNELMKRIKMFADHGRQKKYEHEFEGINSRLDGLQAAILDVKLRYLDIWIAARQNVAGLYTKELQSQLITPYVLPKVKHVFHLYVIQVENREIIQQKLAQKNIATGIHYPIPLPFQPAFKYLNCTKDEFPTSYKLSDKILSLPIYDQMNEGDTRFVVNSLKEILQG